MQGEWEAGYLFFFSSRRRHTRFDCDWSSDVCSSDLEARDLETTLRRQPLVAGRTERLPAKRGLEVAGFTAMGLSSLLIVFALAGDVLHVRAWLGVGGSQLTVVGGAMVVLLIGLWRARRRPPGRVVGGPRSARPSAL